MERIDYINRLPDALLLHILSFLPTVDAVRTVCVPRFRYLWTSLPNLSFAPCRHRLISEFGNELEFRQECIDFVNSVLILHDRPTLDRFSLSTEFCNSEMDPVLGGYKRMSRWRVENMIAPWIHFALSKEVQILNLNFAGWHHDIGGQGLESEYYLPSIVLRSRSLVELYLGTCRFELSGGIQLESLRILSLTNVELSDQMVNRILSGCPLLEELTVKDDWNLDRLEISGPTSLRKLDFSNVYMEKLDISLSNIRFLKLSAIISEIICPNITHLDILLTREDLIISDMPSLIEANVVLTTCYIPREEYPNLRSFLQKLSNATSSKLCVLCIGSFSIWELHARPCLHFNWKHVTTVLILDKWYIPGISWFLRSSPLLENLVIYVLPFGAAPGDVSEIMRADYFFTQSRRGFFVGETFDCLKHHLRNITIQGAITDPCILDLIEFLLGNALVLEKMVISCKRPPKRYRREYLSEDREMMHHMSAVSMVELSRLVSGFRRASAQAEVHLS